MHLAALSLVRLKNVDHSKPGKKAIDNQIDNPRSCCLPSPTAVRADCVRVFAIDLDHHFTPPTAALTLTLHGHGPNQ